jgi:hypothetical protein
LSLVILRRDERMDRTSRIFAVVALFVLFNSGLASGATISLELEVDVSDLAFRDAEDGGVIVAVKGYEHLNYIDYPDLPYRVINILLPQGEIISSYDAEVLDLVEVDPSIDLAPFRGDLLEDGSRAGLIAALDEVAKDGMLFPRWKVRHLGTSNYRGYRIASFAVYPFTYDLNSGRLTLDRRVDLVIETELDVTDTESAVRRRHIPGFREETEEHVRSLVTNPEQSATYLFDDIEVDTPDRGFLPSYLPSMEGSEVAYVIVTNEEMAPAFERLAEWKTMKGVPAVVRTVEWIEQNYRAGADRAESVRNFLQEAYANWGTEWVLLGGDTEIIPARYGYVAFFSGEFIPTDMYFSCLDGNWNADGDTLWGEAYHNQSDTGDDADIYSEVYIGRMPATTYREAEMLVGKTIDYATPVEYESKNEFLMLAEVIFPVPYSPGDDIWLDGADITENIYELYMMADPDMEVFRHYETCDSFPSAICLTRESCLGAMNDGANHVVHCGHGYAYNLSVGTGTILNVDASELTNGDAIFSMYLMNCTNAAFDMKCLAEYFMLNEEGGAFAVTGASRSAFPSASRPYLDYYYYLMFQYDVVQLGKCFTKSREPYTPSATSETADRWTHFIYNYLGDPEVSIFKAVPDTFSISKPSVATFGPNDITIDVFSDGLPVDEALVCLYKENDDYAYGLTDPTGAVTFNDFLCRDDGMIYITVTGLNHGRYLDSIQVEEELDAYLRIDKNAINDASYGNDDGVLDSGESVALFPKLLNTGQADAEKIYAILRTDEINVDIFDSTAIYPDIPVGSALYPGNGFQFSVHFSVPDERPLEFEMEIRDSTGGVWYEKFALVAHAPQLELYINAMSDTLPYGNNNGVIEPGEDFLLQVGLKNFGTGAATGLQGVISSASPNIVITDPVSDYEEITLLETEYGDGFVMSESNMLVPNIFNLELTDAYGRVYSYDLELREPDPPHLLHLDASFGANEIHLTWDPPDSTEHYRYQVYSSMQQGGPYELITRDLLFYSLYNDYGLLNSTYYYYIVTAIDSCGNESAPCGERSISTSPPQLAGWPVKLGRESSCSPVVGDIDGDTHPEVMMGAEYVYALHGDGIEVRDGDGQPVTWGILNTEGDNFTASLALAEIDGELGSEIIGASWSLKKIYIFDHDGNTLPGWPQDTRDLCWASPAASDIDGDGDPEIFAFDIDGILYAWHHDGTELRDGDSDPGTNGPFFYRDRSDTLGWHASTPAFADIDEDGLPEIIMCSPTDSIYCLNEDASYVPGWPVPVVEEGANVSASPAVGDIDDDGHQEVVVQNSSGMVYGLNHDGSYMTGWPQWVYSANFFMGSPALGDLTGDGKLEVVIPAMNGYCHIFDYLGVSLPGWPQAYNRHGGPTESSPTIADLNGDGSLDIVLGCEEGILNAWDIGGSHLPGFPIYLSGNIRGTPMVRDLDMDADLELVAACWDRYIYIWDLDGAWHRDYVAWNGFHGNIHNTGWAGYEQLTGAEIMTLTHRLVDGSIELNCLVLPTVERWDLYRKESGSDYRLLGRGLSADEAGIVLYVDRTVEEGASYLYKLVAEDRPDLYIETEQITVPVASARLYQNHPNPFNPSTTIPFTVPGVEGSRSRVSLIVYDIRGAHVKTLADEAYPTGRHSVQWDGKNQRGESVASGIYFVRLGVGGSVSTRKMVLLR